MERRGINYFSCNESLRRQHDGCIFISHQKKDKKAAKAIADYLISKGVSVYFDEYDTSIDRNDPDKLTAAIQRGIDFSAYMLVLISPNTLDSKWVPWEVGYGYGKTQLSVLTLKGIKDSELPEYLKTTAVRRNYHSLAKLIQMINPNLLTESLELFSYSIHPLYSYLDF